MCDCQAKQKFLQDKCLDSEIGLTCSLQGKMTQTSSCCLYSMV